MPEPLHRFQGTQKARSGLIKLFNVEKFEHYQCFAALE